MHLKTHFVWSYWAGGKRKSPCRVWQHHLPDPVETKWPPSPSAPSLPQLTLNTNLRNYIAGEFRGTPGTSGEHSPHDFLAVRKTVWVPGTVVVIWRVMWKWSTAQATIIKNTVWKREQNFKKMCRGNTMKKKTWRENNKTSDLCNKIICSSRQSCETIPLRKICKFTGKDKVCRRVLILIFTNLFWDYSVM